MDVDRKNRAEEVPEGVQQNEDDGTRQTWQRPGLEKFPLNDAQTGTAPGLADSELLS